MNDAFPRAGKPALLDVIDILAQDIDLAANVFVDRELRLHRIAKNRGVHRDVEIACNLAALSVARALYEILDHYRMVLDDPPIPKPDRDDLPF